MPRIRTFIAIHPGQTIRNRIIKLRDSLIEQGAQAKWVEEDNLHITLLFLGEVDMVSLGNICTAVSNCAQEFSPFSVKVETTGCFPNIRRPRVLWAGVTTGKEQVRELHDALEQPLLDMGCYRREDRKYTPHLTIGRVKGDKHENNLSTLMSQWADWSAGEVNVDEILVMGSELKRDGPVYSVLSRTPLG
ncbi:MAG: RNA 2',3'-cyclic phosphodiesterase [Gemmataceae bacterium]